MFDVQAIEHFDVLTQIRIGLWWVFLAGWGLGLLVSLMMRARGHGKFKFAPPWWSLLAAWISIALASSALPAIRFGAVALAVFALSRAFTVRFDPFGEYRVQETSGSAEAHGANLKTNTVSLPRFIATTEVHACPGVLLRAGLSVLCLLVAGYIKTSDPERGAVDGGNGFSSVGLVCLAAVLGIWAMVAAYTCFKSRRRAAAEDGKRSLPGR